MKMVFKNFLLKSLNKISASNIFLGLFFLFSCSGEPNLKESSTITMPSYAKHFGFNPEKDTLYILNSDNDVIHRFSKPRNTNEIFCFATTQASGLNFLNETSRIKGIGFLNYVRDTSLLRNIDKNNLLNLPNTQHIDKEWLLLNKSALIMHNGPSLLAENLDLKELITLEYLENTPLGRAEWIKVFAWVTNKETLGDSLFNEIETKYNALLSDRLQTKINAFSGSYFNGNWFVAQDNSYMSNLIKDAGASLAFPEFKGNESSRIDPEILITKSDINTVWISAVTQLDTSANDFINSRVGKNFALPFLVGKRVAWINTMQVDFYGSLTYQPNIILTDLTKALKAIENNRSYHGLVFTVI
jgi:iron complex transport system substrate-binding protein